jgi:pre-mRNA-processing factor SLU7
MRSNRQSKTDPKGAAAGTEKNPYIPSFITERPFWQGEQSKDADYLEHQRIQKREDEKEESARRRKVLKAASKWRKGACENCGAMGHDRKSCLEKPRIVGARWSGRDIQADDEQYGRKEVKQSFDAKRDQYQDYDPLEFRAVVDSRNKLEEVVEQSRKRNRSELELEDEDKHAEFNDPKRTVATSSRSLRLREDTASYLRDIETDAITYDPKTRTILGTNANGGKPGELEADDGYVRPSGDAAGFDMAQRLAWDAQEEMGDTSQHLQANPTYGELHRKKAKEESEKKRAERDKLLLEQYGGEEHIMPDTMKAITITETEKFIEYNPDGTVKGAPKPVFKSRYVEDVFINNHTSVWGSWWSDFKWGYACCHSTIKNSYCTGVQGTKALEAAERQRTGVGLIEEV